MMRIVPKFQEFVKKRGDKNYYMRGTYTHFNTGFYRTTSSTWPTSALPS